MVGVANAQGADVHARDRLAHHRVPQGGRVARALDREPGPRAARPLAGDQPGLDELAQGGDLTRVGVDEERRHRRPRLATPGAAPCAAFDRDLQRRGAAERTRRAYGVDLAQLALWAPPRGLEPDGVDYPVLRRYAAQLAGRGAGPRTVARKLAAIRAFYKSLVEHGEIEPTRPTCCPRRSSRSGCRARSSRRTRGAAGPHPGHHAARAARPRAVRARLRAAACAPRSSSTSTLSRSTSTPSRSGSRARGQDALRARGRAGAALGRRATSSAAGPRWPSADERAARCSSRSPAGGCRRPTSGAACGSGRATRRSRARSIRTPCGTRSRPTCSRAARTCARSRSCWAMHPSRRPRSTLG